MQSYYKRYIKFGRVIIRIVSVVGKKNTGKTSLSVKIIEELINRNFKVATIKHSHHKLEMDKENTDTWKHKEAGSDIAVGIGNRTFFNIAEDLSLERVLFLIQLISSPDFIVIEGFKNYDYPKISTSPDLNDEFTLEIVNALNISDTEIKSLVDKIEKNTYDILDTVYASEYGLNDPNSIAKAIINNKITYEDTNHDKKVYLTINEKIIGLNYFVDDFIKNTIEGMLKSLKTAEFGVKDFEKIEIVIKNEDKKIRKN